MYSICKNTMLHATKIQVFMRKSWCHISIYIYIYRFSKTSASTQNSLGHQHPLTQAELAVTSARPAKFLVAPPASNGLPVMKLHSNKITSSIIHHIYWVSCKFLSLCRWTKCCLKIRSQHWCHDNEVCQVSRESIVSLRQDLVNESHVEDDDRKNQINVLSMVPDGTGQGKRCVKWQLQDDL